MITAHDAATAHEEWDDLIDTLDSVLADAAPLQGFFNGGMTSAAEHERSAKLAVLREGLREASSGKVTEASLDSQARCHEEYVALLLEHRDGKLKLADMERKIAILQLKIERAKSLAYSAAKLGANLGG